MGQTACRPACCKDVTAKQDVGEEQFPGFALAVTQSEWDAPEESGDPATAEDPITVATVGSYQSHSASPGEDGSIRTLGTPPPIDVTQRMSILDPDLELFRGISLDSTLSLCGRVWRYSPKEFTTAQRMALYASSSPTNTVDVFISHTWWTPGWQKTLALFVQSTWCVVWTSWALAVLSALFLFMYDLLPAPLVYEAGAHFLGRAHFFPHL